jgi:secreted Zn-dependent insulinase-like peptidase
MPNGHPPNRVEGKHIFFYIIHSLAHLEVHVGSKEETEEEQGIAHFLEHAVFLGTEKFPTADNMRTILASWG